jgi:protein-S-isoprenylcysteine O-methyltransferase Ste14
VAALRTAILATWAVFWIYWLVAATSAKSGTGRRSMLPPGVFRGNGLAVHALALQIVGTVLFVSGLGLAVWARIYLGRNWGMPMTQKEEPELVTSGPYRFVRHPIYTGILAGMAGTALATNLYWLAAFVISGVYFVHSARVEEKIMGATFPGTYPAYKARTKMLIPFVF